MACSPSSPSLCTVLCILYEPGRLMLYLAAGEKSVPCSGLALLNPAPHRCYHSRSHTLGPRINQLHPPNSKQEGSLSCRMRVQRGDCPLPLWFFPIVSLDHTEVFKHSAPVKVHWKQLHWHVCRQYTRICAHRWHTYKDGLSIRHPHNIFFIFLTRLSTHIEVHIAPQIP